VGRTTGIECELAVLINEYQSWKCDQNARMTLLNTRAAVPRPRLQFA